MGIAARGNSDLTAHTKGSGESKKINFALCVVL